MSAASDGRQGLIFAGNTAGNGGRTVLAALRGFATEDGVDTDNNDRETERSESVGSMRATLGSTGRHVEDYGEM